MKSLFNVLKIKRRLIAFLASMHFYGNPSSKLKVIGVTGTNGKTTTATLLYKIATILGYKCGLIGTVEYRIREEVFSSTHTTPGPVALNKLMNKMVDAGCEYVFMEVSSHALDQGRVNGIKFAGGVFTNLTHDHLDYHKSFKNYFLAKKKFFTMLPTKAFALANADDEHGRKMLEGISADPYFYGFSFDKRDNEFFGEIIKKDFTGLTLKFDNKEIHSKLLGRFNAYNLFAVWCTCALLGFDMEKVNHIIENIEPPTGRFEHIRGKNGVLAIVDYAHTPDALEKVLETIREIKTEGARIISVFGCGGDRDPSKRSKMGSIGASMSDIAIFTSDNPRNEDPDYIIAQMKTGLSEDLLNQVITIPDRIEAIKEAIRLASGGDIVLVAGKGHEDYQEIKGIRHHMNDIEELRKLLT